MRGHRRPTAAGAVAEGFESFNLDRAYKAATTMVKAVAALPSTGDTHSHQTGRKMRDTVSGHNGP